MFRDLKGTFAAWVQMPTPACHCFEFTDEVVEWLLHEDGANLQMSELELINHLDNEANWLKDADNYLFQWSIQVGFTSVFLFRITPVPTLLYLSLMDAIYAEEDKNA
jgi:hypothetical protein